MDFNNLPHHILLEIMMYVSIQDRIENVRRVSSWWASVAEDSLRRQRKLTWIDRVLIIMNMKINPTDHHSIIIGSCGFHPKSQFGNDKVKYWNHILALCPNIEHLEVHDCGNERVMELMNLMYSHNIKLKSFTYREIYLNEWPFPLEILESLAVGKVSDNLVTKIMDEATNLKHLELMDCNNWRTFPCGLLSLKFQEYQANEILHKLMNSPASDTIESLEKIYFDEEFDQQTKIFPKLRHVSCEIRLVEERCLESCHTLITFLAEKIPLLDSLALHFMGFEGTLENLFSIPQCVDVLRRLKKLNIYIGRQSTSVNFLNILRACQITELFISDFDCFGEVHDLLSFLVDMSGNIKHFTSYFRGVKVSDLDTLRQLVTSHKIVLVYDDDFSELDIENFVTEEQRQKQVVDMTITAK
jgi:hypothetical protein